MNLHMLSSLYRGLFETTCAFEDTKIEMKNQLTLTFVSRKCCWERAINK